MLLGGRSGFGKSSVAAEMSELLQAANVAHCLVDGDNLDAAYPKAPDDPHGTALTEANLRALWENYSAIGHHRAIYVNTGCVLERQLQRSAVMAGRLQQSAGPEVLRVDTDGRDVVTVAADVLRACGWLSASMRCPRHG